jgi:hypothetical protein
VNGAFEAVEGVGLPLEGDLESLVVLVSTSFTLSHMHLLIYGVDSLIGPDWRNRRVGLQFRMARRTPRSFLRIASLPGGFLGLPAFEYERRK